MGGRTLRAAAIGLIVVLAGCSLLTDAGDPATWLPANVDGRRISYATHRAAAFETRPVCDCNAVITAAGGRPAQATVTRGSYGSDLLVMAIRADGVDPGDMLDPMLTVGQLEARGRTETSVDGRKVIVVDLPSYASGKAYLATDRGALVLIHASSDEIAFAYVRALP